MGESSPLVTSQWLEGNVGKAGISVIEAGVTTGYESSRSAYEAGHIPTAVWLDCMSGLPGQHGTGSVDHHKFSDAMSALGISDTDTVVLYSGDMNMWAALAYWHFKLYTHADVRLLDGGRTSWNSHGRTNDSGIVGRPSTTYRSPGLDTTIRVSGAEVADLVGTATFLDTREPKEFRGRLHSPDRGPSSFGGQRTGHIPRAINLPWHLAAAPDQTFKDREALAAVYSDIIGGTGPVVTYCWVGARSSYTWFVLHCLLGLADVRNYDGSWAEYGSTVGAPVEQ